MTIVKWIYGELDTVGLSTFGTGNGPGYTLMNICWSNNISEILESGPVLNLGTGFRRLVFE